MHYTLLHSNIYDESFETIETLLTNIHLNGTTYSGASLHTYIYSYNYTVKHIPPSFVSPKSDNKIDIIKKNKSYLHNLNVLLKHTLSVNGKQNSLNFTSKLVTIL